VEEGGMQALEISGAGASGAITCDVGGSGRMDQLLYNQ